MGQRVVLCFKDRAGWDFYQLVESAVEKAGGRVITLSEKAFVMDACIRTPPQQNIIVVYFSSVDLEAARSIAERFQFARVVVFTSLWTEANYEKVTMLPEDEAGIAELLKLINSDQPVAAP